MIKKEDRGDYHKMKVVVFSDIHYAPALPVNNGSIIGRKLIQYSVPLVNKLTDEINNNIKPDIVINLGDLIEDFFDHDMDIVNITYIWSLLQKIEPPFYSVTGNHDLRSMNSRGEIEKIMEYNHSTFSIDLNDYHFIFLGLNVDCQGRTGYGGILKTQFIFDEDLKWLEEDLTHTNLPTLIFTHFGLAEDDMKGNWWFEENPGHAVFGNRKEVKEILKGNSNILGVFSGHQHWTKRLQEDNIDYYVLGPLTENINGDNVPDGVYFEIELNKNNIKVEKKHIRL